jgi:tight adherence protein C
MSVTMIMILTLVALFVSVAVLVGSAASYVLSSASPERKRLRAATQADRSAFALPQILPLTGERSGSGWQTFAKLLPRSTKELSRLQNRLTRVGVTHPAWPVVYTLAELLGPVIVGPLPLFFLEKPLAWLVAAGAAFFMYFLPGLLLEKGLDKRRRQIQNGLPDALDLMVVCIEAGSGLDQAIVKTSDELGIAYPALGDEFRLLITEIRAGKPRIDAFKSLAQRTKVDDVRALVATLVQTDRFGTSVGQALRTHADVSRSKRRQRAEEKAQKIAVKLVFPLALCFFPALYVVLLGPAVIQLIHAFINP